MADFEPITIAEAAALSGLPDGPPMRIHARDLMRGPCPECGVSVAFLPVAGLLLALDVLIVNREFQARDHQCPFAAL